VLEIPYLDATNEDGGSWDILSWWMWGHH